MPMHEKSVVCYNVAFSNQWMKLQWSVEVGDFDLNFHHQYQLCKRMSMSLLDALLWGFGRCVNSQNGYCLVRTNIVGFSCQLKMVSFNNFLIRFTQVT